MDLRRRRKVTTRSRIFKRWKEEAGTGIVGELLDAYFIELKAIRVRVRALSSVHEKHYLFDIFMDEGAWISGNLSILHPGCAGEHLFDVIPGRQLY